MNYTFGDIVVVEGNLIGVIVKQWCESSKGNPPYAEVYVRSYNEIREYTYDKIQRYLVRHKELDEEEMMYQEHCFNA